MDTLSLTQQWRISDLFSALEMDLGIPQPSRDLLTIVGETFVALGLGVFPRQVMVRWNQAWKYEVISLRKGFGEE